MDRWKVRRKIGWIDFKEGRKGSRALDKGRWKDGRERGRERWIDRRMERREGG